MSQDANLLLEDVRLNLLAKTMDFGGRTDKVVFNELKGLYHISFEKIQEFVQYERILSKEAKPDLGSLPQWM